MCSLTLSQPTDDPPQVPSGLGHAVHAVNQVDGHEVLAAHPARGSGAMEGQHRHDDVDPPTVQLLRSKCPQVHRRARAHAKTVATNEPGLVLSTRCSRHPRVDSAVGLVAEPPPSSGLLRVRLPTTREREVFITKAKGTPMPGAYILGNQGAAVILGGTIEPPARREETLDV